MSTALSLPVRATGRQTAAAKIAYEAARAAWCDGIKELDSRLDFKVSSRGWCYVLEEYGLSKGDFDKAEKLINACRKGRLLPLDICANDGSRDFDGIETLDDDDPDGDAQAWLHTLQSAHLRYTPISFWDDKAVYLRLLVEKIDLKNLFADLCDRFRIPRANAKGWADINVRAAMMRRFRDAEIRGRQPVLLYAGDHDPAGLQISDFLRSNMADLAEPVGWHPENLIIHRFGLNRDFIDANTLTWIDGLKTGSGADLADPNHGDHLKPYVQNYLREHGARKVEANALVVRPEAGRALLLETILKYLPEDSPEVYERELEGPREQLRLAIRRQVRELVTGREGGGR